MLIKKDRSEVFLRFNYQGFTKFTKQTYTTRNSFFSKLKVSDLANEILLSLLIYNFYLSHKVWQKTQPIVFVTEWQRFCWFIRICENF